MVARLKALSKMVENRHSRLSWGQVGVLPALIWCLRTRTRGIKLQRAKDRTRAAGPARQAVKLVFSQVKSSQVKSSQVKSSQVKSSQVKSSQVINKSQRSAGHLNSLQTCMCVPPDAPVTLATRTCSEHCHCPALPRKHVSCGSQRCPHFIQRGLLPSPPSPGRPYADGLVRRAPSRASCHARASSTVSPCGISICS